MARAGQRVAVGPGDVEAGVVGAAGGTAITNVTSVPGRTAAPGGGSVAMIVPLGCSDARYCSR